MVTVTDANYLLGRLDSESFLGGSVKLHRGRMAQVMRMRRGPLTTIELLAAGILRVVETEMEKAIRVISVEQGHDPRDFTLVAFGGGGPLHACSLARSLRIPTVLIPAMPGALSALGILLADVVREYSRTVMLAGEAIGNLEGAFTEMEQQAREQLDGVAGCSLDLRYRGQGYELNVPLDRTAPAASLDEFHRLHQHRYGFSDRGKPVQIVNLRLRMTVPAEPYVPARRELVAGEGRAALYAERSIWFDGRFLVSRMYHRDKLAPGDAISGPAMITEYTSATIVPPGCRLIVDALGNLVITIGEASA
jgi:N-methylhydantoinase A